MKTRRGFPSNVAQIELNLSLFLFLFVDKLQFSSVEFQCFCVQNENYEICKSVFSFF